VLSDQEGTLEIATRQRRHYEHQDLWDKFWKDKDGNYAIFRRPNALLIAWVVLTLGSLFAPHGIAENVFWWASLAVLAAWSLLEIFKGVNYFRRVLGVLVLVLVILAAFKLA